MSTSNQNLIIVFNGQNTLVKTYYTIVGYRAEINPRISLFYAAYSKLVVALTRVTLLSQLTHVRLFHVATNAATIPRTELHYGAVIV